MPERTNNPQHIWLLLPVFGILLFVSLYIVAALFYPGGSQLDKNAEGFSWSQNYWCNLLNEMAINGQPNTARPIALAASFVLCFSLIMFWYTFPRRLGLSKVYRILMPISGAIAMAVSLLLFTHFHDMVVNIGTLFGAMALTGTYIGLWKQKWLSLFWSGLFCLPLIALNNVLYYHKALLFYLPLVQKLTFLYFLLWVCAVNLKLLRIKRQETLSI